MLYSKLDPMGDETTMVPVGVIQSGCAVTLAVGAAGPAGSGSTDTETGTDVQPETVLRTTIEYVALGAKPLNVAFDWKVVPPLELYSKSAPNGALTTIMPVGTVQMG
jgi:hypothetical protein